MNDFAHAVEPAHTAAVRDFLKLSGLFDTEYYAQFMVGDAGGTDALTHYIEIGEDLGNQPNFLFDPSWYRRRYDVRVDNMPMLFHYLTIGEKMGYAPSALFDPIWYATENGIDLQSQCAFAHYIAANPHERAPNAYFSCPVKLPTHTPAHSTRHSKPYSRTPMGRGLYRSSIRSRWGKATPASCAPAPYTCPPPDYAPYPPCATDRRLVSCCPATSARRPATCGSVRSPRAVCQATRLRPSRSAPSTHPPYTRSRHIRLSS